MIFIEAKKHLANSYISRNVSFKEGLLNDLAERNNKISKCFKRKGLISDKELKNFLYIYRNASNLGKLQFLHKIHKRLFNVPRRSFILNCRTPAKKEPKFLDFYLSPVMQNCKSYIKDSANFIHQIKSITSIARAISYSSCSSYSRIKFETDFSQSKKIQPLVCLRYNVSYRRTGALEHFLPRLTHLTLISNSAMISAKKKKRFQIPLSIS